MKKFSDLYSENKGAKPHTDPSFVQSANVSGEGFETRVRRPKRTLHKEKNRQLRKIVQVTNDIMNDMKILREKMNKDFREHMSTSSVKRRSMRMDIREPSSMAHPPVEELVLRNYSAIFAEETALRSNEVFQEVYFGKTVNSCLTDDGSRWDYFGNLSLASAAKDSMMEPGSGEFDSVDRTKDCYLSCFVNLAINTLVHAVQNLKDYFRREWNLFNDICEQECSEVSSHVEPAFIASIKGEDTCTDRYLPRSHLGSNDLNGNLTRHDNKNIVTCHSSGVTCIR